jgi:hypothetical protein
MKKFIITEEERDRILGMHKKAAGKHYLMEADEDPSDPEFAKYVETYLNGRQEGSFLTTYSTLSPEEAKEGKQYIGFEVLSRGYNGNEFRDNNQYYYQCVTNPADAKLPAGSVFDANFKIKNNILADLKKGGSNYTTFFNKGCKAALDIENQKAQVAAAARLKKEAPNNPKLAELISSKVIYENNGRYFATCTPGQNMYLFKKDGKSKMPVMTCNLTTGKDKDITNSLIEYGYILPQ